MRRMTGKKYNIGTTNPQFPEQYKSLIVQEERTKKHAKINLCLHNTELFLLGKEMCFNINPLQYKL